MGSPTPRRRSPAPRKPPPRRRKPPPREPAGTTPRIVAAAAVAVLLIIAIVTITMVAGGGGDDAGTAADSSARQEPTPAPTRTPTATPKPARTPRPLTPAQRDTRDQAARIVTDRDYEVTRLRDFDPRKTLQVLIGRGTSGNELAFFFVDGEYIGNDSTSSSAQLTKRRGGESTSVVLRYGIFDAADGPGDKPSGDPVDVTFRWDGTRLQPSQPLPAVSERSR